MYEFDARISQAETNSEATFHSSRPGPKRTAFIQPAAAVRTNLPIRPLQVLCCMIEGKSLHDMQRELGITSDAIRNHRYRIRRSLGVRSDQEAVEVALERGIAILL